MPTESQRLAWALATIDVRRELPVGVTTFLAQMES